MYEKMLKKQVVPTVEEMTEYCAENAEQKVVFPYGNQYLCPETDTAKSGRQSGQNPGL